MKSEIMEMLKSGVPIIYDGATGSEIEKQDVTEESFGGYSGCMEALNLYAPHIMESVHNSYLNAGAMVIETNTFGGSRTKLSEYGLEDRTAEVNRVSAEIASSCASAASGKRWVCGTMGPTGLLPSGNRMDDPARMVGMFDYIAGVYAEQAEALLDGGADFLLFETNQDLFEVRAALIGVRNYLNRSGREAVLQVQVTMESSGRMLLGSDINAYLGTAANLRPDIIGFNCSTGPEEMRKNVAELISKTDIQVSMIPNAGMPENIDGRPVYTLSPERFADSMVDMVVNHGVSVAGGCCGTGPGHIEALAERLKDKRVGSGNREKMGVFISTGVSGKDLSNLDAPGIIGERLNVQGSRKAKEYFLNGNIEELEYIGRKQEEQGADLIDLSLAVNERDSEADDLAGMAYHLSDKLSTGFCLDSTDPEAFEKSLKCVPGSVLINSVNLESGGTKARRILKTASEYMCPVIALPIDDEGMALDYERKIALIDKIYQVVCTECGLPEGFLFIDPLVLTLGSGEKENRNSVTEALKALDYMKEKYPGIRAVMGVSNVSFGLKPGARRVLNNLLLYHAGKHGLDLGIFDPGKLDSIEDYDQSIRKTGEDLLFNRSDKALERFIEEFSGKAEFAGLSEEKEKALSPGDRLFYKIVNRDGRELEKACGDVLETTEAEKIIDDYLLAAMSRVGEMWDKGDVILPFVLQSAEIMQKAIKCVEPHLKKESQPSGRIILATVFGDVHDIGKNLVSIILNNQGFEILDLGKQVKVESIIEKVKQEGPDAVGLSALLVSTSKEMQKCVQSLADEGLDVPVLIGGAPVNKKFAEKISKLDNGEIYRGGVYYASNGFEAAGIIHDLKS